ASFCIGILRFWVRECGLGVGAWERETLFGFFAYGRAATYLFLECVGDVVNDIDGGAALPAPSIGEAVLEQPRGGAPVPLRRFPEAGHGVGLCGGARLGDRPDELDVGGVAAIDVPAARASLGGVSALTQPLIERVAVDPDARRRGIDGASLP